MASNFALHWTGSSRFSLFQWVRRWRLLPASELRRWAYTLSSLMSIPAKSRAVSTGGSHPTVSSRAQRMAHSMPYAMRCSAGSLDVSTSRRSSLSRRLMVRSDGPTRRSRQHPPRLVCSFAFRDLPVMVSFLSLGPASVPDLDRYRQRTKCCV